MKKENSDKYDLSVSWFKSERKYEERYCKCILCGNKIHIFLENMCPKL